MRAPSGRTDPVPEGAGAGGGWGYHVMPTVAQQRRALGAAVSPVKVALIAMGRASLGQSTRPEASGQGSDLTARPLVTD